MYTPNTAQQNLLRRIDQNISEKRQYLTRPKTIRLSLDLIVSPDGRCLLALNGRDIVEEIGVIYGEGKVS